MSAKYMVIDISSDKWVYPVSFLDDMPEEGWTNEYKKGKIVLRHVSAGEFEMAPEIEWEYGDRTEGFTDNCPHKVMLRKSFYVGVFPVTQQQWLFVMGSNPSRYRGMKDEIRPVECVSYEDVRGNWPEANWPHTAAVSLNSFIGRLRARTGLTAIDLPTEAQWEYACRAEGKDGWFAGCCDVTMWASGDGYIHNSGKLGAQLVTAMKKLGWFYNNQDAEQGIVGTHPVGGKSANGLGIYDMHGNVLEWCLDWYRPIESASRCVDPKGNGCEYVSGGRVVRGGHWQADAEKCFSTRRNHHSPGRRDEYTGLRLCCQTDKIDVANLRPMSRVSFSWRRLKLVLVKAFRSVLSAMISVFAPVVAGYGCYGLYKDGHVACAILLEMPLMISTIMYWRNKIYHRSLYILLSSVSSLACAYGYLCHNWHYAVLSGCVGLGAIVQNGFWHRYVVHSVVLYLMTLSAGLLYLCGRMGICSAIVVGMCLTVCLLWRNSTTWKWWRWAMYMLIVVAGAVAYFCNYELWGCVIIVCAGFSVLGKQ